MTTWAKGSDLHPVVQADCLRQFVHRFTKQHRPMLDNRVSYCESAPTWPDGQSARTTFDETVTSHWPVRS